MRQFWTRVSYYFEESQYVDIPNQYFGILSRYLKKKLKSASRNSGGYVCYLPVSTFIFIFTQRCQDMQL